jgi:uncharacterized membrane protein
MAGFWVVVLWAVAAIIRHPPDLRQEPPRRAEPTALEILERRYASGELSDEEFEAKRHRLRGQDGAAPGSHLTH